MPDPPPSALQFPPNTLDEPDMPPHQGEVFVTSEWIGVGKAWKSPMPHHVRRARNEARIVPFTVANTSFAPPSLSVLDALAQFQIPNIYTSSVLPAYCYDKPTIYSEPFDADEICIGDLCNLSRLNATSMDFPAGDYNGSRPSADARYSLPLVYHHRASAP